MLLERYRTLRLRASYDPAEHRGYVGGLWEELGRVQLDFLVGQGLQPDDILLDVGCGSLRAGRLLIEYLDAGHYLGLDHNAWLIEAGLKHEVPARVRKEKRPTFVVSDRFEFREFDCRPTYALAQSLFSHLIKDDIRLCLENLVEVMAPGRPFFATFVPKGFLPQDYLNPEQSCDLKGFHYDAEEILEIGRDAGWRARYIGDWGHPRGQEMLEFTAPKAAHPSG